ncbi:PadR family transcriptional regulator [Halegenticoccus tardaugens]|uniref:PadR family transcriptional regulator n=1 Tax=Halegenticoccus tardaugens TaxID=2071624 RepID=UPI00100AEE64|nr:PadR family transcriptional regulator [Halegenticoccus tardaugens]
MTLFELSNSQRDLLTVIVDHDQPSGQQLKTDLEDAHTKRSTTDESPNLDVLVDMCYVEKGQINRRTNYYKITDEGRTALSERREWEDQWL